MKGLREQINEDSSIKVQKLTMQMIDDLIKSCMEEKNNGHEYKTKWAPLRPVGKYNMIACSDALDNSPIKIIKLPKDKRLPRKLKLKLYGRRRDRKPGLTYIKNIGIKFTQS